SIAASSSNRRVDVTTKRARPMATNQLRGVLQTLRRATAERDEALLTDGQLLASYVRNREEAAFAALVQRHGPMVWGRCRRLLPCPHDAQGRFQAPFPGPGRRATPHVPKGEGANLALGGAPQTAVVAPAAGARRGKRKKQGPGIPEPGNQQEPQ